MAEQKILYKIGSKGDEVGKIQTALGDYYTKFGSKVDNDYGNDTAGGVWDWQTQWNKENPNDQIKVDGIVGPQTYPRLMQWAADKNVPATQQQPTVPATGTVQPGTQPALTNSIIDGQTAKMNEVIDPSTGKAKGNLAPKYLVDWSNVDNVYQEAKRLNLPLAQVLADYQRWGNDTGNPTYWINAMFQDSDLNKSVADNEAEKKKAERRERWNSVNNFLLHLGNVIGNVGGGGYASMKLEDPVQWTERQRQLRDKALEQRRLNNQSILTQMHKDWAAQRDYELKKQQAENLAAYRQTQAEAARQKSSENGQVAESKVRLNNAKTEQTNKLTPLKEETEKARAKRLGRPTSTGRSSGKQDSTVTTVNELDRNGKVTKSTKTTTYGKGKTANKGKVSTGVKWKTRNKK